MPDLKIYAKTIEQEAIDQINLLLAQEAFKSSKVRIMPDVHAGKGCVIGFTANLGEYVIPNIVGVDIGCGMLTVELTENTIDFDALDSCIRQKIPFGKNVHEGRIVHFDELQNLNCYRELKDTKRLERSVGSLGGGNHFIEIDKDDAGRMYLVIHTGSRNLGKQVAELYQNLAIDLMSGKDELFKAETALIELYKTQGKRSEIQASLKSLRSKFSAMGVDIPKELCYLSGEYRIKYLHDMRICQAFAVENRNQIARLIIENMGLHESDRFETIHNYIDIDSNIVRKGAISAANGERVLIPINMRDGCVVGVGKGNDEWNQSAPHGAGRLMSRTKARDTLSLDEYRNSMSTIFSTSVSSETIDQAPMAYKPIDEILDCISDTVSVEKIIKPVYNFKASE